MVGCSKVLQFLSQGLIITGALDSGFQLCRGIGQQGLGVIELGFQGFILALGYIVTCGKIGKLNILALQLTGNSIIGFLAQMLFQNFDVHT